MAGKKSHLYTTPRLGIRLWHIDDIPRMAQISGDPEVMRYFPAPATYEQTKTFVYSMMEQYETFGYCYFPLIYLKTGELIGFTGLKYQTYDSVDFMPCTDIGWRLGKEWWGRGLATEAARAALDYGFTKRNVEKIYAVCPVVNTSSENVMIKLGMERQGTFEHPLLNGYPHLQPCYYYAIDKDSHQKA